MKGRPKIKLTHSSTDKTMELTGWGFFLLMWALTFYLFHKSPKAIPVHFNDAGTPDRFAEYHMLFALPIFATVIYLFLTFLNKYPHRFNYLQKITEENALRQYTIATRMIGFLKLSLVIMFSALVLLIYLSAIGITNGLGIWFLPVMFAWILIPVIISIRESLKKH